MTDVHITIANKTYAGATQATIADFSLSLQANEFVCLLGSSGCGKTTLLNCLSGLDNQYDGEILVGKQHTTPKIGYIFQNPRLLPWRTVRENIELVLEPHQSPDLINPLLDIMQLTQVQHEYPERLSVGMNRRVAIIRAFAVNPDLLLMDEPFVSLDPPTARDVRALLLQLWQQRPHTVLFVTHDLREAIALADRLIFLASTPMRVISDIVVPIPRTQRHDEAAIEQFRQQLINHYPDIKQLL
ncbi:MAG: ABC transporter ATP-binding protein [Methylococcales bacterium]|nr:ABC transporter ATP-binding protein [Methylococcales bacterium]MDP3332460.1 ABC transporter ATP-binding protein [Methylococcaceae bacterium]MDP3837874.1 ABC transporter ATP-binding protein [Methylococcales bacterium]